MSHIDLGHHHTLYQIANVIVLLVALLIWFVIFAAPVV